ncbi:M15 family metallopeptidase [Evtepia sp.]
MARRVPVLSLALLAVVLAGLIWLGSTTAEAEAPRETALPTAAPAQADPADWRLTLVNPWTPLPEGYQPTLTTVENGYQVDQRCANYLEAMLAACREAGLSPVLCSAYRTQEKQTALYENLVGKRMAQGLSREDAEAQAAKEVARPGTSEHQLGLAVDIVDASYQLLDARQEDTPVQQWLMEHCWEYGFLLRYPPDKGAVTGIIYEPWHYRYVGRDHAQAIGQAGLCLEEFLTQAGLV